MTEYEKYLEKYSIKHEISKEEAEQHKLVQEAKVYYEEKNKGRVESADISNPIIEL